MYYYFGKTLKLNGMPKSTYIKAILTCFTSMDVDKLRLYLKEEYSYQDTTKEIFLNEVEEVFKAHKYSGDTELLIYKGACCSKTCDNCGVNGYRFVGNHSKNYLDLLFEMDGDDIKDIFDCAQFETHAEIEGLQTKADIYINLDDQVTFHKTPEYWAKVYSATAAYSEMITTPPKLIDFDELSYWVDKHTFLNNRIGSYGFFKPSMRWTPFSTLYAELKEIKSYISTCLNEFIQANLSLENIETEQNLIDWLMKYEAIYEEASFEMKYVFVKEGGNYITEKLNSVNYTGEKFNQTFAFINSYQEHNEKLLKKFNTYTEEEETDAINKQNSQSAEVDLFSLKFHLQKRKALEDIGIQIPFNINQEISQSDSNM